MDLAHGVMLWMF